LKVIACPGASADASDASTPVAAAAELTALRLQGSGAACQALLVVALAAHLLLGLALRAGGLPFGTGQAQLLPPRERRVKVAAKWSATTSAHLDLLNVDAAADATPTGRV
jgi:hypothetical protein